MGGGARPARFPLRGPPGLSPRGRGSLLRAGGSRPRHRSIPAWAGEPPPSPTSSPSSTVYPRVGGGAHTFAVRRDFSAGLSPRGRGSPSHRSDTRHLLGSIPAWAGEPIWGTKSWGYPKVYPRVGGGAVPGFQGSTTKEGLSPRGRGSPDPTRWTRCQSRSIPAWAGEPHYAAYSETLMRVYPRVGGGAVSRSLTRGVTIGLSPRGRGSLIEPEPLADGAGSIPAWAGEPSPAE